jgi:ribonuclease VapC
MTVVLDASAILALLNDERGAETVFTLLDSAVASAVNVSEVVAKLAASGGDEAVIREAIARLQLPVIPFDEEHAYAAGLLRPLTRPAGLSFGDRACLALAQQMRVPAITTDRRWAELQLPVTVRAIR